MERFSLKNLSKNTKIKLLEQLRYKSDEVFVLDKEGNQFLDRYSEQPIKIDNMVILPGNSPPIILDNNPLSITSYLEEFGDIL